VAEERVFEYRAHFFQGNSFIGTRNEEADQKESKRAQAAVSRQNKLHRINCDLREDCEELDRTPK
jgi:hypothetical protein